MPKIFPIFTHMKATFQLPKALQPFVEQILATEKKYIQILPSPSPPQFPWESKFGGVANLPTNINLPFSKDGQPLHLLIQINFEEMPFLPPFPSQGLLQIFIADNDLYGFNVDSPSEQNGFRIYFFQEFEKNIAAWQTVNTSLTNPKSLPFDSNQSFALNFAEEKELVPPSDFNFQKLPNFYEQFGEEIWRVLKEYEEEVYQGGHKIGGYADFTQEDPRTLDNPLELLLQIDSDHAIQCQWGDMGIANFFISREELLALNFSNVIYNWDCY